MRKKRLKLLLLIIAFSSSLLAQEKYVVVETTFSERIICQFSDNIFLIYQDTYIMGDPGRYMGVTKIEVPKEYFTIR